MDAIPQSPGSRGSELLVADCASLDSPGLDLRAPTASERLTEALGAELAHKLVFALSATAHGHERFAA